MALTQQRFDDESFQDKLAFFAVLVSLVIFYPELFLARSGALIADHLEQHYPWADLLWQSLHRGVLPFWTPLIQCGFPIAAEGQIGIFYLPNLLLYGLLPIQWAYTYMHAVHYLLVGWGTYAYARQMKLIPLAAFMVAFIYVFGTSYGGAYYNVTSLKALTWFPWLLFIFERFYKTRKFLYVVALGFLGSLVLLAGYLQIAILALFVFVLYGFLRLFLFPDDEVQGIRKTIIGVGGIFCTLGIAVLISLPQLLLTFDLAMRSNRALAVEGYAYVGSLFPGALATLIFPLTQILFRGNSFYMGIFSLFLIFFAFFSSKTKDEQKLFRLWVCIAVLTLLLALGQWSPLYIGLIKLTHFYSFRTPAKFLIFVCFSLSMLSGIGFQKAWLSSDDQDSQMLRTKVSKAFFMLIVGFCLLVALVLCVVQQYPALMQQAGDWFIRHFLFQKPGHPHSLLMYQEKMQGYLRTLYPVFSFKNSWSLWSYFILGIGVLFTLGLRRLKIRIQYWLVAGFVFLFLDLYAFSFFDIKTDFDSYEHLKSKAVFAEKLAKALEQTPGRIYGFRQTGELLPLTPNANMLYGIEEIGAYSPFVFSRYYETIGQLGNVNDSNFIVNPSPQFVLNHLNLLNFLDVAFVVSTQPFHHPDLSLEFSDPAKAYYLYRNQGDHARAFFVTQCQIVKGWEELKNQFMASGFDPRRAVLFEESELQKIKNFSSPDNTDARATFHRTINETSRQQWEIETDRPGFFVISNTLYPGWHATLNGQKQSILYAHGLFQGIWISRAGRYVLSLRFNPL
ncbi:MAG TPA: hypothetical protein PLO78_04190 [Candidatus Omnitrophota bacterium]|nr:hypothetical protein [Candidatus Omnitrophota bacterium]